MKKLLLPILLVLSLFINLNSSGQCLNADFSNGNFGGWSGTNCTGDSSVAAPTCAAGTGPCTVFNFQTCPLPCTIIPGVVTIKAPNPFLFKNLNVGPVNQLSNQTPEKNHFIMTSGFDAVVGGTGIPVVCPGFTKSARLGNQQANGGGESLMYKYLVTPTSNLFTYNYAAVLNDGSHGAGQQPYFKIRMWVYNNPTDSVPISCATYDVDASTAASIGGFTTAGDVLWKPWSAVTIPLKAYEGKMVSIQFITRDCCPSCDANGENGTSGGGHFAFAYIDASCGTQAIIPSANQVCAGQSVTLSAPVGAAKYAWVGPAGATIGGATTRVATVTTPGTYTVNMTTFGTVPCDYFLTVDMPGNLAGGANVSVTSAVTCQGGSATLTASGAISYTWSNGAITPSITVMPASTTSYTVTGASSACGSGVATGTVTVNPVPTSPFTITPACAGANSTITYTGNATSTDTYTWNFGGATIVSGGTGQGPHTVTWPTGGTKTVTLFVTVGTCISPVTTNTVAINPPPTVTTTPVTICANATGTLTAAGASTYLWSEGTPVASMTSIALGATTSYSVTGTDANGCKGTAVGTITVNPLQNPAFSYNPSTVCQSGGSDPTPIITGVTGGTFSCADANLKINTSGLVTLATSSLGTYTITYTTPGPCPGSTTFVLNIVDKPIPDFTLGEYCQNVANPKPTPINGGSAGIFTASPAGLVFVSPIVTPGEVNLSASTPGTYNVTNTISGAGCPATTFTNTIIINPIPVTSVNPGTVCAGTAATLNAAGANTYLWSTNETTPSISVQPGVPTSYTVTGTSKGCSSSAVSNVVVNPIPTVTVNSATICAGQPTTLAASGASTYSWSPGGTTGNTLAVTPPSTTSYIVTGTSLGCSATAQANVTVNQLPTVTAADDAICQGSSSLLTANGAQTYVWIAPGNVFSIGTTYNVTPASTTSYTVIGSTANCNGMPLVTPADQTAFRTCFSGGCSSNAYPIVSVNPVPTSPFTVTSPCIGAPSTITYTGNAPANATYTWNFNGGIAVPATGQGPFKVTWPAAGTQNVTLTVSLGTCSSQPTTVPVTTNPLPVVGVTNATICTGDIAKPLASNASTYVWNDGTTANPASFSPAITTSYTVTGTDAKGCKGTAVSTVTVNNPPTVSPASQTICAGQNATLTAASSTAISYLWTNGINSATNVVKPSGDITLTVTATDASGCTGTNIGFVRVIKNPVAEFNASPNPAIVSSPFIDFTDASSKNVTYWKWDFGDGDTLAPNTTSPQHTYPNLETTYTVTLTVRAGLCEAKREHQVVIGPEFSFFIPNAFTPDGDGDNDLFFGKGKGIIEYQLMIFDRWGNFIFHADDLDKGWNGKANGGAEIAQQDVYVWKVELTDVFKKKHNFIGTVTIVRGK
jgi:gliding motility-associated-like protein